MPLEASSIFISILPDLISLCPDLFTWNPKISRSNRYLINAITYPVYAYPFPYVFFLFWSSVEPAIWNKPPALLRCDNHWSFENLMAIYQARLIQVCHETHSPMNHLFSVSIHRLFKSPILLLINVSSNQFSKSPYKQFNHIRLKHGTIETDLYF